MQSGHGPVYSPKPVSSPFPFVRFPSHLFSNGMLRRLSSSSLLHGTAVFLLLVQLHLLLSAPKHKCSDLSFDLKHPNRTVKVTPVDPESTYSDLLIFTYHQSSSLLSLNNANCHLQISNVDGMARHQLQFLKPYLIKAVIQHSRSPHVGYIDWDANFIRRPWNPPVDLVVQSNPLANSTNTGLLLFFNKEKHIPTIDAWIQHEIPTSHDQWTWALMERSTNVPILRTADGEYGENYNWNVRGKSNTTARCNRVIFHLSWFRFMLSAGVILAVVMKLYDFWSMQWKGYCPKRAYLSFMLIVAITLSVFFKEQYHQQEGYEQKFFGERVCAIPEIALREEGSIVTRQDTVTSPNEFLKLVISIIGLDPVASFLSFWFSLLARMRTFTRVILVIEMISLLSLLCFRRSSRAESLIWCTLMQWRDFDASHKGKAFIGKLWKDGEIRMGVIGNEYEDCGAKSKMLSS